MNKPTWLENIRETGLLEWVCEHGIGHPDFQSANEMDKTHGHEPGTWSVHGCDGCCGHPDFPGRKKEE